MTPLHKPIQYLCSNGHLLSAATSEAQRIIESGGCVGFHLGEPCKGEVRRVGKDRKGAA